MNDKNYKIKCIKDYYDNGNIKSETYLLNNKFHNENAPAYILYYENGNKEIEEYYVDDLLHNINGPASLLYDKNGKIRTQFYYIHGTWLVNYVNSDEELKQYIKLQNIL